MFEYGDDEDDEDIDNEFFWGLMVIALVAVISLILVIIFI